MLEVKQFLQVFYKQLMDADLISVGNNSSSKSQENSFDQKIGKYMPIDVKLNTSKCQVSS